jgi:hypothetical protein
MVISRQTHWFKPTDLHSTQYSEPGLVPRVPVYCSSYHTIDKVVPQCRCATFTLSFATNAIAIMFKSVQLLLHDAFVLDVSPELVPRLSGRKGHAQFQQLAKGLGKVLVEAVLVLGVHFDPLFEGRVSNQGNVAR